MYHPPRYDRALLLGSKRNEVLALDEVQRYGEDSFGDPDYVSVYGLGPAQWYARGVRLMGRTAVECTRDRLASAMAADMAQRSRQPPGQFRGGHDQVGHVRLALVTRAATRRRAGQRGAGSQGFQGQTFQALAQLAGRGEGGDEIAA
jgi:hypothetical protein